MKRIVHILLLAIIFIASACERRPLVELSNTHYVRVYIDEEIKNMTCGFYSEDRLHPGYKTPDIIRVILADPVSGQARAERFLRNKGEDSKGTYYDGYIVADPGHYCLLAYNFDTESTIISEINNQKKAKASTSEIAPHLRSTIPSRAKKNITSKTEPDYEKIVYDPDHLFASSCGEVYIPYVDYVDTLRTPEGDHFHSKSIVKSYYLQVRVKGLEFSTSSVGLMTGMSGSSWLTSGLMDESDPVTVYFNMVHEENTEEAIIYTTFSTFGKIPDLTNELEITFDFPTIYGEPYSETLDISDIFLTKEAKENQWLLLDHVIEIPEPPEIRDEGFKPGLDDWSDVESDIII